MSTQLHSDVAYERHESLLSLRITTSVGFLHVHLLCSIEQGKVCMFVLVTVQSAMPGDATHMQY